MEGIGTHVDGDSLGKGSWGGGHVRVWPAELSRGRGREGGLTGGRQQGKQQIIYALE